MSRRPRLTQQKVFLTNKNILLTVYTKKPSEIAKDLTRDDIPDAIWNRFTFKQQQIFLKARKKVNHSQQLTNEIQAVFRSNRLLAEYA